MGRRCRKHMRSSYQRHAEFAFEAPEGRRGSFGGWPNIEESSYTLSMILQQACRLGLRTDLVLEITIAQWHPLYLPLPGVHTTSTHAVKGSLGHLTLRAFRTGSIALSLWLPPWVYPNPATFPRISFAVDYTRQIDVVLLEYHAADWKVQKGRNAQRNSHGYVEHLKTSLSNHSGDEQKS